MSCEDCKLAQGDIKNKIYYNDNKVIVVDCLTCNVPLIVWKDHTTELSEEERNHMHAVIQTLFGFGNKIRKTPRSWGGHTHWHILKPTLNEP